MEKPQTTVATDPQELEQLIRERAFRLFEERGREDGHDTEDWLRAEAELTGTAGTSAVP